MALLSTPVEKAERRLASIRDELTAARARLTPDLDFDRGFALREEIAVLERKEAAAADTLNYHREQEAKAAAEVARAKSIAEVDAYRREATREMPARFNKIAKLQEQLAEELAAVTAHVERADSMNKLAHEVGVPGVVDGEMHCRGTKTRIEPAVFEERDVVRTESGRLVHEYWEANGALHSHHGPCTKRRERVEVRGETVFPGGLPGDHGRICDGIELMDVKTGNRLWPR